VSELVVGYHCALNFVVTGFTLAGAALPQLVVASDCENTNPDELAEEYAVDSEDPLQGFFRWYFGGGLAVGVMAMGNHSVVASDERSPSVIAQERRL
jgi:hypothetical protein